MYNSLLWQKLHVEDSGWIGSMDDKCIFEHLDKQIEQLYPWSPEEVVHNHYSLFVFTWTTEVVRVAINYTLLSMTYYAYETYTANFWLLRFQDQKKILYAENCKDSILDEK